MADADITFHNAEPLTWVQSMNDINGTIDTVVFKWSNATVSFKRSQLDELLGALHIVTSNDTETVLTRYEGDLVQVITDSDGFPEFFPLGVNA